MATLKEQIVELTRLKHRLAVWEMLASYLDENFIPKDGRKAPKSIRVPGTTDQLVPEETIESVLQALGEGPITELAGQIKVIEDQEVTIISPGGTDEQKSSEA